MTNLECGDERFFILETSLYDLDTFLCELLGCVTSGVPRNGPDTPPRRHLQNVDNTASLGARGTGNSYNLSHLGNWFRKTRNVVSSDAGRSLFKGFCLGRYLWEWG